MILAERSCVKASLGGGKRYMVRLYEVSLIDHLIWRAYHWYDMRIPTKFPAFRKIEKFLARHGAQIVLGYEGEREPRWRDRLVSWSYGQDLRCHHLGYEKGRIIGDIEITKEMYDSWKH
jgi:hypothetical protein